jgi:hypothetical protein
MIEEVDDIIGWAGALGLALAHKDKPSALECIHQIMDALSSVVESYELDAIKLKVKPRGV